ncbi:MAG: hypothetical protein JXR97_02865, partial [Planctomycetes bacterium]|nr:hypothetical protein [Planctomycetota bacterium]
VGVSSGYWDGKAGDGEGATKFYVAPTCRADGSINTNGQSPLFMRGKTFLRRLLLRNTAVDRDDAAEFMLPMVFIKDEDGNYVQVDKIKTDTCTGCQVRMLDDCLGIEVAGNPNHKIALNHFSDANVPDGEEPEFDYSTLVATVAMETDERLRVEAGSGDRVLRFIVPEAQCWYVNPNTVVGLKDGELYRFAAEEWGADSNVIRNDYELLRAKVELAHAWHSQTRALINLTLNDLGIYAPVGAYVTRSLHGSASQPIGTVITGIQWDFGNNAKTTITTGWRELDVVGMNYEHGISDAETLREKTDAIAEGLKEAKEHTLNLPVRIPRSPF